MQKDVAKEKESELLLQRSLMEIEAISTPIVPIRVTMIGNMNKVRVRSLMTTISDYIENSNEHILLLIYLAYTR
ncbi:hypothetical protein [Virgibacillus proomii]|uniref:hypothetical protein n=1 Tax=Virgibacillus proomii TaxID=84407 RepID=UPI001C10FAD1|nr:hypothetical protein [Virgibacillus proomii]MBU5267349.1 hypothetical protein [Virgibacillus proomii]